MHLVERLREEAMQAARETGNPTLKSVTIGINFTLAELSDGRAGIAYTNPEGGGAGDVEGYLGKPAGEALGLLSSPRGLAASTGLAVANALLNTVGGGGYGDPVLRIVSSMGPGRAVLIGFFKAYVKHLLERGWEVTVHELRPFYSPEGATLLPWWALDSTLPRADLVIVTGSSLANRSLALLEELLRQAPGVKVMVGPSTPRSRVLLGVFHALGYSIVRDPEGCRRLVTLGYDAPVLFRRRCLEKATWAPHGQ